MIHKTAEVQSKNIGDNTSIWQYCVVFKGAQIGHHCNINFNVLVENDVIIGNYVTIKPGVQIWDGLRIEDYVFIGPNVTFTNDLVPRSKQYPDDFGKTYVLTGASIGANATILSGLTVGEYALIGAGSVITKSVPPFTVWYGNPAKQKGYITKEGIILNMKLLDKENKRYKLQHQEPVCND